MMERTEASIEFEAYWRSLCPADGGLPQKADINPAEIKRFLEWTIFATVADEEDQVWISLVGQRILDLFEERLSGKDFNLLGNAADPRWRRKLQLSFHDQPCGRVERLNIRFDHDMTAIGELTILPVRGPDNSRVLFCLGQLSRDKPILAMQNGSFITHGATDALFIDIGNGVPSL